jgi:hypothetical protein
VNPFGTAERERGRPCQIVIAYDTVAAGRRAMRLVSSLRSNEELDCEIRPLPWRFDLPEDPDWRDLATADAVKADVLMISSFLQSNLPPAVWKWIAECLELKRGETAAVVALFGADGQMDHADSDRLQLLTKAAREAELAFFTPSPVEDGPSSVIRWDGSTHVEFIRRSVDGILYPGVFNRDWGLNE